jgi:hypothetical protein
VPDVPGRDLPGGHRPGLRRVHADPAHQRLCRARERRHALPAADRARSRRPDGRSSARSSRRSCTDEGQAASVLRTMRNGRALDGDAAPHLQPGRSADQGRRQVGHGRVRHAATRRAPAVLVVFVGFSPKDRYTARSTRPTRSSSSWPSPTTRGRRATPRPRSSKYFFQLHFDIEKDYRLPELLERGNFYRTTDGRHPSRTSASPMGRQVGRAAWRAFDLQLATYAACSSRSAWSWPTRTASRRSAAARGAARRSRAA